MPTRGAALSTRLLLDRTMRPVIGQPGRSAGHPVPGLASSPVRRIDVFALASARSTTRSPQRRFSLQARLASVADFWVRYPIRGRFIGLGGNPEAGVVMPAVRIWSPSSHRDLAGWLSGRYQSQRELSAPREQAAAPSSWRSGMPSSVRSLVGRLWVGVQTSTRTQVLSWTTGDGCGLLLTGVPYGVGHQLETRSSMSSARSFKPTPTAVPGVEAGAGYRLGRRPVRGSCVAATDGESRLDLLAVHVRLIYFIAAFVPRCTGLVASIMKECTNTRYFAIVQQTSANGMRYGRG